MFYYTIYIYIYIYYCYELKKTVIKAKKTNKKKVALNTTIPYSQS